MKSAPSALATATYRPEVRIEGISADARIVPAGLLCTLAYRGHSLLESGIAYARTCLETDTRPASAESESPPEQIDRSRYSQDTAS